MVQHATHVHCRVMIAGATTVVVPGFKAIHRHPHFLRRDKGQAEVTLEVRERYRRRRWGPVCSDKTLRRLDDWLTRSGHGWGRGGGVGAATTAEAAAEAEASFLSRRARFADSRFFTLALSTASSSSQTMLMNCLELWMAASQASSPPS